MRAVVWHGREDVRVDQAAGSLADSALLAVDVQPDKLVALRNALGCCRRLVLTP